MLEITDYYFEIIACLALGGLCFANYLQRSALMRLCKMIRCERSDRLALENDVQGLLACSKNIGERVLSQDAQQNKMLKKLDVIDLYRDPSEGASYDQVHRMIEQGIGVDEIAEICDLRQGEVELLSHIASHRTAA